jgi:hypothetical protein
MGEEDYEKFECPDCHEWELEDLGRGLKCGNCGYEVQRLSGIQLQLERQSKYLLSLFAFTIYLIPILIYFLIALAICGYMLCDTYNLLSSYRSSDEFIAEIMSPIILYILLSLAIMDLSALVAEQYLKRISFKCFWGIPIPVDVESPPPRQGLEESRRYIAKLIAISIVLILMHIFHKILACSDNIDLSFAVLITGCLFGASTVLIAVGLWKILDSKGDQS